MVVGTPLPSYRQEDKGQNPAKTAPRDHPHSGVAHGAVWKGAVELVKDARVST